MSKTAAAFMGRERFIIIRQAIYHPVAFSAISLIMRFVTGSIPSLKTFVLAALLTQIAGAAELTGSRSICGPEIVTIGDAWEKAQMHVQLVREMLERDDLGQIPQKTSAISSHLRFMQNGAIMVYGKRRSQLEKSMSVIDSLLAELSAAALGQEVSMTKTGWAELETLVKFFGAQFPEEALLPSVSFAHLLPPVVPLLHIQLEPVPAILPNRPMRIVFQLVRRKDIQPVGVDDIISTHGAALHALICDRTLTDYHHEHPTPTGRPGEWEFTFTPKFDDVYRLWINAIPKETGREEFPVNTISLANPNLVPPPPTWKSEVTAQTTGLQAQLSWTKNEEPTADRPINGTVHLSDTEGRDVDDLEPYMGAYAHIVGIAEDMFTVLHAHPDGANAELSKVGGNDLQFSIRPPTPGFYRLFVQIKRRGKIQTLPFGFQVRSK